MTWDYRLILHDRAEHPTIALHEVYYNDDGSIRAITEKPIDISWDAEEDTTLLDELNRMKRAAIRVTLKESEIVFNEK